MKTTKAKMGFNKLKLTYLVFAMAALFCIISYGRHVYAIYRDAQVNMPQPQVEKLIKDLRLFKSRTKRFPGTFNEINGFIWHKQPAPDYGENGRQARTKNYFYFYTKVNDSQCALWAIPLGPRRNYAATFFLVISTDWVRIWQGKALDELMVQRLPAIPSPNELANLQMQESPARVR